MRYGSRREFLFLILAGCTAPLAACTSSAQPTVSSGASQPTAAASAVIPATANAKATAITGAPAPSASASAAALATPTGEARAQLAAVSGASPEAITRAAIRALGGMGLFVGKGQRVLIKPNICASREPEYAATTNPEVVATLVKLCQEAGAGKVVILDNPFYGASTAYRTSGIEAAVKAAGGEIELMSRLKYKKTAIPEGKDIKSWGIYQDALDYDVVINVPIAKTHNLATLTLGMKNLLGVVENPGGYHGNLGQRLADLTSVIRPQLTVLDAVRILTRNGPTGGDLNDVKQVNTVVASADPVATDAYGATFFNREGTELAYVRAGAEMGLGTHQLSSLRIAELKL